MIINSASEDMAPALSHVHILRLRLDHLTIEKRANVHDKMHDVDEHFVEFSIGVEWKLSATGKVGGFFRVDCPLSFPLDSNSFQIPVKKHSSSRDTVIDTCIDDFFVDCAFRNTFVFKLRFSPNKKGGDFTEETILLDATSLFMRGKREEKVEVSMKGFESVIFDVKIDEDLLSEAHLKRFCPAFFYISTIENLPQHPDGADFAPVYVTCRVGERIYNLLTRCGTKCAIETAIVIAPRTDAVVLIEVHDREFRLPGVDQFRGSGLHIPFEKEMPKIIEPEPGSSAKKRTESRHHHRRKEIDMYEVTADIEVVDPTDAEDNEEEEFTETPKKIVSPRKEEVKAATPEKVKAHTSPSPIQSNKPLIVPIRVEKAISPQKAEQKAEPVKTTPRKRKRRERKKPEEEKVVKTVKREPGYGFASITLLPERKHQCELKSSDADHSSDFSKTRVNARTWDPAQNYPSPGNLAPVPRPQVAKKRPIPVEENQEDSDQEDPKILALEPRTAKLVRWIVTCPRNSACALDLSGFIADYHREVIRQWNTHELPSFQWSFRQCADLITGFHFASPKEEIFVLETRLDRKTKATNHLSEFLKNLPDTTHILGNLNRTFKAPRLYCCFNSLVKRVEVPIPLDEMLQIKGLYFLNEDNHKLFSVSQKLSNLMQSKTLIEAVNSKSFPTYAEIKMLLRRAPGLYTMPVHTSFSILPKEQLRYGDFGDPVEDSPVIPLNSPRDVSDMIAQMMPQVFVQKQPERAPPPKEKERLTRYILTRPQPKKDGASRAKTVQTLHSQPEESRRSGRKTTSEDHPVVLPPAEPKAPPKRRTPRCKSGRRFPAVANTEQKVNSPGNSSDVRRHKRG